MFETLTERLGSAFAARGRTQEAILQLTQALRLKPNYPEAEQKLQELIKTEKP